MQVLKVRGGIVMEDEGQEREIGAARSLDLLIMGSAAVPAVKSMVNQHSHMFKSRQKEENGEI